MPRSAASARMWSGLKRACELTREQRLALLDRSNGRELPIRIQAFLLGPNRSGLYYKPVGPSEEELAIKRRIDEIYTDHPYYGSPRITAQLRREGYLVDRKAVQRHMREMGIEGIRPGPNLGKRSSEHRVYPYLLHGTRSGYPNHVWGIDGTYIRLLKRWTYLVAMIDWYSRYVVFWELDGTLETTFVLRAVGKALIQAKPDAFSSDQGSQFTSPEDIKLLEEAGVQISTDGKGRATDNIFTERFWRSLEYGGIPERVYEPARGAPWDLALHRLQP